MIEIPTGGRRFRLARAGDSRGPARGRDGSRDPPLPLLWTSAWVERGYAGDSRTRRWDRPRPGVFHNDIFITYKKERKRQLRAPESARGRSRPSHNAVGGRPVAELPDVAARPVVLFLVVLHLPREWGSNSVSVNAVGGRVGRNTRRRWE